MKKHQKLRISVLLLTAICLSCFLFYACQKKQVLFNPQYGVRGDKTTVAEARAYFDKKFSPSKSTILGTTSSHSNESVYEEIEKTPIWDGSLSKMISTGTNAIVVPLEKKGVFVKTRSNKMVPFGFLNYLMMYKDSTNAIITEWVSLSPSEKYFAAENGGPYDGLIFVMDWEGNLKKSFSYKDGVGGKWEKGHNSGNTSLAENMTTSSEETVMSPPNPPDCVLITFYTYVPGQGWYCTCNQHPTYDASCNCQAYTVAPKLETNTFLRCVDEPPVDPPDFPPPSTGGGENPVGNGSGGGSGDPNDYNPTNCNPDPDYVVPSTPPPPGQEWVLPCRDLIPPEETDVPGITEDVIDQYGFYASRKAELGAILENDPTALLPCDEIANMETYGSQWQNIATFEMPQNLKDRLDDVTNYLSDNPYELKLNFQQTLENAKGSIVNCDYFPVRITSLPNGYTPESLLEHFRRNINDFITNLDKNKFDPFVYGCDPLWPNPVCVDDTEWFNRSKENAIGSMVHIKIRPKDAAKFDGTVMLTDYTNTVNPTNFSTFNQFTFTTLYTALDKAHPVAGNRRFGVFSTPSNPNEYIFYTSGVDRAWDWVDKLANDLLGDISFNAGDQLWEDVQANFIKWINDQPGGQATLYSQKKITARPKWSDVKDYLQKKIDFNTLKQRLGC